MHTRDEGIRPGTTVETLANLKPAFKPDGKVTAGNSSQITDGASAVLIMSEEKAKALGLTPRARFHTFALAGVDPVTMLTGPIPSTQKALEKSGLSIDDIDLVEINEAFASVVLAWEKELHPDMAQGQRQRRRHRPRPPARLLRRQAHGHAAQRARAHRRPLRPADHVRGRRHGQRHHHRAPRLTVATASDAASATPARRSRVVARRPVRRSGSGVTGRHGRVGRRRLRCHGSIRSSSASWPCWPSSAWRRAEPVLVLVAAAFAYGILRIGVLMLGGLARPVPDAAAAG